MEKIIMGYDKRKDAAPRSTIDRIKGILSTLGVEIEETIEHPVSGVCSSRLEDKKHGWGVNGKGTSDEYCLASGYGEAMERLQFYYAYDFGRLSTEALKYGGFYRFPDETPLPVTEIKARAPQVYRDMKRAYALAEGKTPLDEVLFSLWEKILGGEKTTFAPFYSVKNKETVLLPEHVISFLCGSNGLCAGNTPAEAVCQGMCEVMERYAKRRIVFERLTPPDVPREYIKEKHSELYAVIEEIESLGDFRIYVKDASLGKYPVAGIALVDRKKQRYHVKFGAHPSFAIALERCFTELLQGYTPGNEALDCCFLTSWEENGVPVDSVHNRASLDRDDVGRVPDSFFAGKSSWEFKPWNEQECTNAEYARRLSKLLCESGDVYIRAGGYLGVPAFRIYAPGISSGTEAFSERMLELSAVKAELERFGARTPALKKNDIKRYIDFIESVDTGKNRNMIYKNNVHEGLVYAALLYDGGDAKRAAEALKNLPTGSARYRCAARDMELAERGVPVEERDALLEMFFGEKALKYTKLIWRKSPALTRLFDPTGIAFLFEEEKKEGGEASSLHIRLKDEMMKNMPSQSDIGKMLVQEK